VVCLNGFVIDETKRCPLCGEPLIRYLDRKSKAWLECGNPECPVIKVHYNRGTIDAIRFDSVMSRDFNATLQDGNVIVTTVKTIGGDNLE